MAISWRLEVYFHPVVQNIDAIREISKCSFPPMAGPIQVIENAEVPKKRFKPNRRKIAVNIGLAMVFLFTKLFPVFFVLCFPVNSPESSRHRRDYSGVAWVGMGEVVASSAKQIGRIRLWRKSIPRGKTLRWQRNNEAMLWNTNNEPFGSFPLLAGS